MVLKTVKICFKKTTGFAKYDFCASNFTSNEKTLTLFTSLQNYLLPDNNSHRHITVNNIIVKNIMIIKSN